MRPHLKTLALTAAAAALTVSLTACGSSDNAAKEVTVVGSGQVRGAPDILNADIGIEVVAPDVSGAVSEANDKARQMIDAIVAAGVAPEDVQTSDLSVQPQYDASGGPFVGGNVTGYRATNSVRIVVRDLDKASSVLDAGIAAGGNAARARAIRLAFMPSTHRTSRASGRAPRHPGLA
ncbi:SIMPL domain-containing protein [Rhodococcus qingshengii]|uniref:SIMPL domain-containing protein n=1 Tax=Rhodococcus qingshengii TaxID=334542 RepID=UPI00211F26B6|nr:SIMPL domain-containing protein [Rhodococcus qingshengii]